MRAEIVQSRAQIPPILILRFYLFGLTLLPSVDRVQTFWINYLSYVHLNKHPVIPHVNHVEAFFLTYTQTPKSINFKIMFYTQ